MVAFFCRGLDKMHVQPLHQLVPNRSIFVSRLSQIENDEQGKTRVETAIVITAEL
jgi:hypothetical protein